MKAKFVYENISFNRGALDPKVVMGIGVIDQMKEKLLSDEFDTGGRDLHRYVKSVIAENPEFERNILFLIKQLHQSGEFRHLENMILETPEIFLSYMRIDPGFLESVIKKNPDEMLYYIMDPSYMERLRELGYDGDLFDLVFKSLSAKAARKLFTDVKNTEGMKESYRRGANPASGRIHPYIAAIDNEDLELLKILLEHGVDPSTEIQRQGKYDTNYPIRRAASQGWVEGFKELLADPRTDPSAHNNSALVQAERAGHDEIVDLLLKDPRVRAKISEIPKSTRKRLGLLESVSFQRGRDPRAAMGIGKKAKILDKLERYDIKSEAVEFGPGQIPYPSKKASTWRNERDAIIAVGMETMEPAESDLAIALKDKNSSVAEAIGDAWDEGMNPDIIRTIIDHYCHNDNKFPAKAALAKLERSEADRKRDEDENVYIFIGYMDKVPVEINGKQYFEEKFMVENMMKVDTYDPATVSMVQGMKLRARYQSDKRMDVYKLRVPKELMDEDNYYEIPDHLQEIVEKYKVRI